MAHKNILDIKKTALVVIDVQEGFRNVIPDFALVASRISLAVRGFQILGVPVVVTEQYPKGLGPTAEEIRLVLSDDIEPIDKTAFSSCGASSFLKELKGIEQVVLCGLETQICVSQTAHDLLKRGFQVHLLTDCVCSRFEQEKAAGLAKMQMSGVIPAATEMALFELMRDAKHKQFKEIQALIK
jgi:nicotinamidase-related amidase